MAGTATLHTHRHHLPVVTRTTLRFGWPRKLAAGLMVLIGAAFVALTLIANLFHVGPAFDRMTDGFRPILTQQAIQIDRQDIAALSAAGTEIQTKMLPALAQQLNVTPAQLSSMISTQYPDVAAGLKALPTITPSFTGLINTLDQQRPLFQSADAIPTKDIPATAVPWSLLAVGIVTVGLGVFVWFTPRASAVIATVVGAVLIAAPLSLSMVSKASDADQMNANLEPVYTQQLITQSTGALTTLSAMGTQLQQSMLPALATQLNMTPAQLQSFLGENFPATAAALTGLPASMGRFENLVATFDNHLSDYKTLKPVSFEPIVWSMIIGGGVLFLLGAAGVVITRKEGTVA
jgi:hypothetical protein